MVNHTAVKSGLEAAHVGMDKPTNLHSVSVCEYREIEESGGKVRGRWDVYQNVGCGGGGSTWLRHARLEVRRTVVGELMGMFGEAVGANM